MGIEILVALIGALLSLVSGGIVSSDSIQKLIARALGREIPKPTYSERLSKLTSKLAEASSEVDEVLQEISLVSNARQASVEKLESELENLEKKEKDLSAKVKALQETPLEAAAHFADLISTGEKRGAKRDYFLFGAGVLITTLITIILQFLLG